MTKRVSNNKPLELTVFNYCVRLLAQSSRDLAARFGQQRTVDGQIALIREELAEVLAATDDAHRVEELCDLIVVCCGVIAAAHARHGTYEYPIELDSNISSSICLYDLNNWAQLMITMGKTTPFVSGQTLIIHIYRYLYSIPNAAELFPAAVAAVVAKNAAKTDATHYLDGTGKIVLRRETTLVACPRCSLGYPPSDFVDGLCPSCVNEAKKTSEGSE